jgi:hypothetical protein
MLFEYRNPRVLLETDDWSAADGAMLTPDDEVVPMIDLNATAFEIEYVEGLQPPDNT